MADYTKRPASFKTVQIIYYGLFIGQALMAMVLFYVMQAQPQQTPGTPFNMIIPGAVLVGIAASYLVGQQRKQGIPDHGAVQVKLEHFQTSKILQFALMEGGNLVSLILTFSMANTQYLLWFGVGLAAFSLLRPSRDQFMEEYQVGIGEGFE